MKYLYRQTILNIKRQDAGWIPTFPVQPGMTLAKPPPLLQDKCKFDDTLNMQVIICNTNV